MDSVQLWLRSAFSSALVLGAPSLYAQEIDDQIARMMSEGWRAQTTHVIVRAAGGPARRLSPPETSVSAIDPQVDKLRALVELRGKQPGTRAVLISQSGILQVERYLSNAVSATSSPIGNSMSKSLVSLAVGKALCQGKLASLDLKAEQAVESLAGTSWGRSSVRDLLRMTSGAFYTDNVRPTGWKDQQDVLDNRAIYSRRLTRSFVDLMKARDSRQFEPGSTFNYNNYDTVVLNLVVEKAVGKPFATFFAEQIWSDVGAERDGAWVTNQLGEVAGYFGFSAAPRDWVRLGEYVLEKLAQDDCFGRYLREATTEQVKANWPFNKSYGYQIWTNCTRKPGSFCFVGNHGQQLILHPASKTVLYVHGITPSINGVWREVFDSI
jgi:CubicO group peptidase (beta-lactamase class C family)